MSDVGGTRRMLEAPGSTGAMRRVTLALDCRAATARMSGVGRYIVNLAQGLSLHADVELVLLKGDDFHPVLASLAGVRVVDLGWRQEHKSYPARLRFEQVELRRALRSVRPDVFHATWNFGIPLFSSCPTVLTLHDLLPLELENYFGSRSHKVAFMAAQYLSLMSATRIVAVSEATRLSLMRRFAAAAAKTDVILEGVEANFSPGTEPSRRGYVLYVGGRDARKNIAGVLLGYAAAVRTGRIDVPLYLTGHSDSLQGDDAATLASLAEPVRGKIEFLGFVADEAMPDLYRHAAVLLFPSRAEGFGFPPLEAMACGTPVVTCSFGSIPEVVGDAALFVDADDPSSIAEQIVAAVTDHRLRDRLVAAGLRRAEQLRWPICVDRTLAVYGRLLGRG